MIPDVWRVPTVLGVIACSALMLFGAVVVASIVIRARKSTTTTVPAIAVLALLALGAVVAIRVTAWRVARALPIDVAYVDPRLVGYLAPLLFAAFAFFTGDRVLNRVWTNRRALVFCVWVIAFTALNVVNYCSPGWCETIGFPFPWSTWSDVILTFGDPSLLGVVIDRAAPAVAALLDLLAFVAVALLIGRSRRLGVARMSSDSPPSSSDRVGKGSQTLRGRRTHGSTYPSGRTPRSPWRGLLVKNNAISRREPAGT